LKCQSGSERPLNIVTYVSGPRSLAYKLAVQEWQKVASSPQLFFALFLAVTEFQNKILPTYLAKLYAHNSSVGMQLAYTV